jgi:hypothetical protein
VTATTRLDGAGAAAHRAQADALEIEAGAKRCLGRRKDVERDPAGGLGAGSEGRARPTVRRPVRPLTRWSEYNSNIARQNGVPLNLGRGARD